MVQMVKATVDRARFAQVRPRRFGLGARRSPVPLAAVVTDEQIAAIVTAAQRLSEGHRDRHATVTTAALHEQLLRLDWAVRAGQAVLADRAAARALTLPGIPATAVARRRQFSR